MAIHYKRDWKQGNVLARVGAMEMALTKMACKCIVHHSFQLCRGVFNMVESIPEYSRVQHSQNLGNAIVTCVWCVILPVCLPTASERKWWIVLAHAWHHHVHVNGKHDAHKDQNLIGDKPTAGTYHVNRLSQ